MLQSLEQFSSLMNKNKIFLFIYLFFKNFPENSVASLSRAFAMQPVRAARMTLSGETGLSGARKFHLSTREPCLRPLQQKYKVLERSTVLLNSN